MTIETVQFDWRGMRCPEPILKTAREIRQLRDTSTSHVSVLADDSAFPMDIERWCKSSGVRLGEIIEREDGFEAILVLQEDAQETTLGARSAAPAAALPQMRSSLEPTASLDCLGMCCPEPIMKTARQVRGMESGVLEILADDSAFPKDLESWIRNAKAELISIEDRPQGGVRALLRVGDAPAATSTLSEEPSKSGSFAAAQQALARGVTRQSSSPELSSKMSARPVLEPTLEDIRDSESTARLPTASTRVVPALAEAAANSPMTRAVVMLNLDDAPEAQRLGRVQAMGGAQWAGEKIGVSTTSPQLFQEVIAWAAGSGQTLLHVDAVRGELLFRVGEGTGTSLAPTPEPTAMVKAQPKRATYLVIHNDFESLMAAMMIANTAAVQGMETTIFFSFWGVNLLRGDQPRQEKPDGKLTFIHRLFRMMMPRGPKRQPLSKMHFGGVGKSMMLASMKQQNVMSLESLVDAAVDNGVKFLVCTMSMNIMGIHKRDIIDLPNIEFAGVASFVADAAESDASMVF